MPLAVFSTSAQLSGAVTVSASCVETCASITSPATVPVGTVSAIDVPLAAFEVPPMRLMLPAALAVGGFASATVTVKAVNASNAANTTATSAGVSARRRCRGPEPGHRRPVPRTA